MFGTTVLLPRQFCFAIKTDNVYRDLEKILAGFDTTNYDEDHSFSTLQTRNFC